MTLPPAGQRPEEPTSAPEPQPLPQYGVPLQPAPAAPDPAPVLAPAPVQQLLVPVETEPLEYHRLYRGMARYAWWKPLLAALLGGGVYFGLNFAVSLAFLPLLMVVDPDYLQSAILDQTSPILDTQHPWSVVMALVLIALMIPAVLVAMLALGIRPTGRVWSVAGRIRWSLVWRSLGIAALALVVQFAVNIAIGIATTGISGVDLEPVDRTGFDSTAAIASVVIVLFLVPFQAAAEEVMFRGMFLQVLGSWLCRPWVAIAVSTIAFSAMHIYDIWGLIGVGMLGLTAAWLTWKTGGLEAAISIHTLNNVLGFAVMATGAAGSTGQVEDTGGPDGLLGQAVGLVLYAWLVTRTFRKHGYGRERIDIVLRPVPVPPAQVLPQPPAGPMPPYGQTPSSQWPGASA